jgi:hypothetical protein
MRMRRSAGASPRLRLLAVAGLLAGPGAAHGEAITGICPDGSVYIVRHEAQIPCKRSKQVQPHEVPPLRPEYLPTPYTWQVWSDAQDPNNPYNLIDAARQVQGLEAPGAVGAGPPGSDAATPAGEPGGGSAPSTLAERAPSRPLDLGLDDQELRNLFLIVDLSQEHVPVQFARNTADGRGVFRVAFAHSAAFETRLRDAWASRGGLGGSRILLFTALSKRPADFHANFTFVQRHLTYQPDVANPRQIGLLQGRFGSLAADEAVLGYVVLPETMDLGAELDIYWNDRRTSAAFGG